VIAAAAIPDLPEVRPGDDLAALLRPHVSDGDVLVVAHKVVSKAEGRVVRLADVTPGERALALAAEHGKDARHVQVILDESAEIVRSRPGVLICRTHHGFVCANAGVDGSNAGAPDTVVTLPRDPDASARALRARLGCAVVISDSFGRPWRYGIVDVAIGVSGLLPLEDLRGTPDHDGRVMKSTVRAVADELASAAELTLGKRAGRPVALVRGAGFTRGEGSIRDVLMPEASDLFR